jgi:signal transduction histidine kinase
MLNNLINDMLDLAKFESGTFKFHNEFFDFIELLENAFETIKFQADKKNIKLNFEILDERNKASLSINTITMQSMKSVSAGSSINASRSFRSMNADAWGNGSNDDS